MTSSAAIQMSSVLVAVLPLFFLVVNGEPTGDLAKNNTADYAGPHATFHAHNTRLYAHLMEGYHKQLSPYYTNYQRLLPKGGVHPPPMLTSTTLSYVRIIKLDQMEQVMKIIAELRTIWHDYRLAWDPAAFGDIEHIYMARTNIWVPELNVADCEVSYETVPDYKQNVFINYTGHVLYYYSVVSHSVCPLQTQDFPFDDQSCALCLIEGLFNKNESSIDVAIADRIDLQRAGNGEWDVTGSSISRKTINDYASVEFDYMCFDFALKRKSNFYVMVIIVPTFIITTLSITGVFAKRLTGEDFLGELSLGLTSLMTLTVMLGIVADSLPKTNTLPILSIFLTIDVTLTALSVLVVILHPRIFYPKIRAIRSRMYVPLKMLLASINLAGMTTTASTVTLEQQAGHKVSWISTLIRRRQTSMTLTANIVFMIVFQSINFGNLYYILSFWW